MVAQRSLKQIKIIKNKWSYRSAISINIVESFKNNFNLMELYNRNIINGEDNIGELLTGKADDNTEGIE